MPTIIDGLLVTLGLDTSAYEAAKARVDKGLRGTGDAADKAGDQVDKSAKRGARSIREAGEQAQKTGKQIRESADKAAAGYDNLAKGAAKFLALVGGTMAIKRFIEDTVESSAALGRLAQNLSTSVENVSAWSNATALAGGTAAGLQGTLDMLSKAQTELQLTGQSSLIPYFSALGMSMADAGGKARPVSDILLDLSGRFGRMDRTTANNMGRMMGLDQGTMNLLLRGRSEVETMIRRQKEYGVVTKRQAEESSRLQQIMVQGRQTFEAFGRELLSAALPALEGLLQVFSSMGDWMLENKEFMQIFLSMVAAGLVAIGLAATPVNLTIAAVTALGAAIALLYQDYLTWKRGGESFIDWGKWEPGFKLAAQGIRYMRDLIEDLVYRAIAGADVLSALWDQDWERVKFAAGEFVRGNGKKYGEEPPAAVPAPTLTANLPNNPAANEQAAIAYFTRQGWTREQAVGMVANLKRESNINPTAVGDNGQAYGIGQWHPDRQGEFAKRFGKPIQNSTLQEQLAFMHFELSSGKEKDAGQRLANTKTAADAARVVSRYYERPRKAAVEAERRAQLAVAMLGGAPGAADVARGAGAAPVAQAAATPVAGAKSNTVETHIGEIKIYSAATDADGIARDMGNSMNYLFTSQANYGLN